MRLFHATSAGTRAGQRTLSHRKQEAAALRAGRRTGLGEGQEVVMAGTQQAVSLSPGLGGVNSKALTDGGTMSPHFPNSPRGTPLLALELHTQTHNKL